MKTRQYSQDATLVSRRSAAGKGKLFSLPTCLISLTLCIVLSVAAFGGYYLLSPRKQAGPLVLIHAPQNGEQLIAGQPATVQAVASDSRKIVRVELWVNGQLLESQSSNVAGGIASFPLLANWQPASAGAHMILVRAFNTLGARAHSTINVNVIADRDGDGTADDADVCPDQPGPTVSRGCPDRDLDGTPDSADACPDVAGLPEAGGCASVGEGDRDGDGSSDVVDACPDVPGPSLLEGCPDADGDMVADIHDACPAEPGAGGSDGCPAAAGDVDGDGVPDGTDVCPSEWGLPEHGGCPEVLPGADGAVLGGGTSDSDGDGASDDVDPCPTEAGLPENGFCPPPGESAPSEGGAGLDDLFTEEVTASILVEFEALHFEVTADYGEVWCYAQLAEGDMERYDFAPGDARQWDIAAVLGGENSVQLALEEGAPAGVFVECFGMVDPAERPRYLGSVTRQHVAEEWDGHVIVMDSIGGEAGHSFQVRYHLCATSCEATALQPPVITSYFTHPERIHINWDWEGDRLAIDGFKLYLNGNLVQSFPRDARHGTWWPADMTCVDTWEFHVTAFGGPVVEEADIESPPSNTVVWEELPCRERVRVTFESLNLHTAPADEGGRSDQGPITGTFSVTAGADMESVDFDAAHCMTFPWPIGEMCFGLRLNEGETSIQGLFDEIRASPDACGGGCPFDASASDTVTISLNPEDDLTITGLITDADVGNPDDTLFNESLTVAISELSPDSTLRLTIHGDHVDLNVLIDRYPFGP